MDSLVKRGWGNITPSEATVDGASSSSATTAVVNQQQQQQHPNIRVLPIQRTDWLKVFLRGCFDIKFWQNTADPTRPAFAWYLNHVANEIQQLTTSNSEHDNDDDGPASVILVGHSAGGWLGRAALGYYGTKNSNDSNASKLVDDDDDDEETNNKRSSSIHIDLTRISGMVTLGAPHLPPPPDIMDMTRGALRLTHENYPGAFFSNQLFYITVIGDAVRGMKQVRSNPMEPTSMTGFAYNSYEAVCGNGEATGDGT